MASFSRAKGAPGNSGREAQEQVCSRPSVRLLHSHTDISRAPTVWQEGKVPAPAITGVECGTQGLVSCMLTIRRNQGRMKHWLP